MLAESVYENQIPFNKPFQGFMKGDYENLCKVKKSSLYVALS